MIVCFVDIGGTIPTISLLNFLFICIVSMEITLFKQYMFVSRLVILFRSHLSCTIVFKVCFPP